MRTNPFDGKGTYTKFVWAVYARFMSRAWFSHADVMADYMKLKSAKDLPYSISKCEGYGELKKALPTIIGLLKERCGKDCIETDGNNRSKRFRYVGEEDDPFEDLKNAQAIKDIQTYAQFCIDSAGFFPSSWIEYFFEDTIDLLKITKRKKSGEQFIASSADRELKNIEFLPVLYEAIRDKRVLKIKYKSVEDELIFHPHILKEFNGRWFLFGHAEGKTPEIAFNIAIDRLLECPEVLPLKESYISAPKGFYSDFFRNKIGVSPNKDSLPPEDIVFRARNYRMFNLVQTKKLHPSQTTVKTYGEYDGHKYGEFSLHVEVNNEFIGKILQMGAGLEIISPNWVREIFKQRTANMADLYR